MVTWCKPIFQNVLQYFESLDKSLVRGGQDMHSMYIYEAEDEVSTIESLFLFYGIQ